MLPSAPRGSVWKRVIVLAVSLPLFGGLLLVVQRSVLAKDEQKPAPGAKASPTTSPSGSKNWKETVKIIDDNLQKGLPDNKVTPAIPSLDYEFIRRATLD